MADLCWTDDVAYLRTGSRGAKSPVGWVRDQRYTCALFQRLATTTVHQSDRNLVLFVAFWPAAWLVQRAYKLNICHLSPVHTSYNIEATFDFVEATFDFVAKNANNVELSSFRQSQKKLNMFNFFRLCRNDEISFDIFAETAATLLPKTTIMSKQHSTLSKESFHLAFYNVASTLLLVWTGLK